ncbi:MAG: Gldg family protein [Cyanobacteria bacterium J06639_16]
MDFFERYAKYLKHLVWPGLTLFTAGLVSGSMLNWTLLPIFLLLTGLILIGSGIFFGGNTVGSFWRRRSTQASTNALIATLALILILALVNFLAVRYLGRLDLTENQLFTLAPQSQSLVQDLAQPVKVVVFDAAPNPQDEQLLKSYRRQNPEAFSFEYVDPVSDPITSQQFGVQSQGEVYLVVGEKRQLVQRVSQDERLSERQLTNELDQITRDRDTIVYFLQGHGEYAIDGTEAGLFEAVTALEDKNYTIKPLNFDEGAADAEISLLEDPDALAEELDGLENPEAEDELSPAEPEAEAAPPDETATGPQIPDDANVVILAGPQQGLFESEAKALETYLDNGGSALIMVDPNSSSGVELLLAGWGITLDGRLVIDTSGTGQLVGLGPAAPLVTQYGDHPITQDFANGRSFYPVVQPLVVGEVPGINSEPLLYTAEQSQVGTISETGDLDFNPETAEQGPFVVGVALDRTVEVSPISQADPGVSADPLDDTAEESNPDSADADVPDAEAIESADPEVAEADAEPQADAESPPVEDSAPADTEAVESEAVDTVESEPEAVAEAIPEDDSTPNEEENAAEPEGADSPVEADSAEVDAVEPPESEPEPAEAAPADAENAAETEAPESENNEDAEAATAPEDEAAETAEEDSEPAAETAESRLVVIGNSSFATDGLFDQQLNGDVFINAVSWLSQDADATLSISPKEVTNRRILMTPQQQISLAAVSLLILPLAGVVGAVVMWLRRR